ncbi:MAG TPA: dihydrolipoamide acetyltransferase family protein [Nocardioidaceae bacterium]|nr:dihydrolipoamide acetyltransferase family protein [Nocardioidaceae bacterium]
MPDVLMPRLSDTMTEGVLSAWLKHEGDAVQRGDVLAEIETDKAVMELESYDTGVLTRILVAEGTTVPIGAPIAVIGEEGAPPEPPPPPARPEPETAAVPAAPAAAAALAPAKPTGPSAAADVRATPLVRRLAREHDIDLAAVTGTGPNGRIVRADVEELLAGGAPARPEPAAVPVGTGDEEVPLTALRRITAERLIQSAAAPHFYLTMAVDAGPLLELRADLNRQVFTGDDRCSVTDLLVRAVAVTLAGHRQVNASWAGDRVLRRGRVNVGIAVALENGLIVPVVRDADRKALAEIVTEAHALTRKARAGRLTPDEFSEGTFTISNLGTFGVEHFTAVINPPEAAILAVGGTVDEPVVREGQVVVRPMMRMTLTSDHRVLDGAVSAAFLRDLVDLLGQPLRLLA